MKDDYFEVEGKVISALPNAMFKVKLNTTVETLKDKSINCHISGKIRKHSINILPGDTVTIAISPYDMSKGRIVFRHKG